MASMLCSSFISVLFLSTCCLVSGDDSVQILRMTMPEYMKNKALNLISNGFANQMDLNKISDNITNEFNNNYGAEWFSIVGPSGFVAHFNTQPNTLLWLQYNELEIIIYKPSQADDFSLIKSARIGQYIGQYIHSTVNSTNQNIIRDTAKEVTQTATTFKQVQSSLRYKLQAKLGGQWLVIVTSSAPSYDSDWDSNSGINYAMEFDLGSLRFFVYNKKV